MTTSPTDRKLSRLGAPPRQLGDDVLQSAEEAVLSDSTAGEGALAQIQFPEPAVEKVLARYQDALAGYAARKPFQSALVAAAVGALAALVLKSALTQRRR